MTPNFDGPAFSAAVDLIFKGRDAAERLYRGAAFHTLRREAKAAAG